jgi:predicted Zn-dependent protease
VAEATSERAETSLRMLQRLETSCRSAVRRVDAVMRTGRGERTVATSRGFRADWRETSCSIDLWADELAGASYARRCLPTGADLERLASHVSTLGPCLRPGQELPAKARGVLYMPNVVQDLLGRFLLSNLAGRAIRDGRSPFARVDVDGRRQIVRPDLDLTIDTTLPFEPATAPCSSEGVPAGRTRLLVEGRLATPTLDLATAAELGLPPTPAPRGRPSALLTSTLPEIGVEEALALLGDGVVVRDLPGLNTQQARRGVYALVVPDAQAVVGGEAGGRCAVRLAGGFLDHLSQPSTRLVRIPGDLSVGLLVLDGMELLPA